MHDLVRCFYLDESLWMMDVFMQNVGFFLEIFVGERKRRNGGFREKREKG